MEISGFLTAASWWDRNSGALTFAGVIIAILFGIVGIVLFLLQRDKKTFDWQVLTDEPIVTGAAQEAVGGIRVFWQDDIELSHPRLLTVRLINTGKREVRPEDFDGEVLIRTSAFLGIRSAYAIRHKPGMRHRPKCSWTHHECTVESILYNRGDWVDIQLLVDRGIPNSTVDVEASTNHFVRLDHEMGLHGSPLLVDSVVAGQTRRGKRTNTGEEQQLLVLPRDLRMILASFVLYVVVSFLGILLLLSLL